MPNIAVQQKASAGDAPDIIGLSISRKNVYHDAQSGIAVRTL